MGAPFGLVVDLHPWPDPVDLMVLDRLASPLRDHFTTVRSWHPVRKGGDEKGARAAAHPDLAAVILSGSVAMVGDHAPWMARLGRAVDDWCGRGVAVLGTCFGHQFLAHHLGGRLGSFSKRRVALEPLHIVDDHDPLFEGLPPQPLMLWTHRDLVLEVPPTLLVTATSDLVPVEAFRHRDLPLWGVQAHPEADARLAQAVAQIDPEAETALRRHPWTAYDTPEAKGLLERFVRHAATLAERRYPAE